MLDRPEIRRQLNNILPTDAQLMEFLTDYFPDVQRTLTDGMDRTQKLNRLIQTCEVETIKRELDLYEERAICSKEIDSSKPKRSTLSKAELAISDARRQLPFHPYTHPRPKTDSQR